MAITTATGTPGVAGNLQAEQRTYFSKQLLKQAKFKTVLDQFGHVEKIPAANSKTISFTQYADLAPAVTPLTEGTPPTDTSLTTTAITATIDQLGAYVTMTDLAPLTPAHPVTTKTLELLGVQAARTYDRVINSVIVAGTSVIYPGAIASRATIGAANVLTFAEIKKAVALLRNNGATEFSDGKLILIVDPSVEQDLMSDTNFANTVYRQNQPTKENENYKGRITSFAGVTVVVTNNLPTIASTVTVHTSYVLGQDAYAVSDLQTLTNYTQKAGGITDPLEQRMTMGWKVGFKAVILNNNFMVRLESASAY